MLSARGVRQNGAGIGRNNMKATAYQKNIGIEAPELFEGTVWVESITQIKGIPVLDCGVVEINGQARKLVVRYDDKPEVAKVVAEYQAAKEAKSANGDFEDFVYENATEWRNDFNQNRDDL